MTETNSASDIVYFTRLHWIIFFWPVVGLLVAIVVHVMLVQLHPLCLIFELGALLWLLITLGTYYFSSLTIKRNRVILQTGIIVRQTVDMPLNKIETIDIRQSILGSILRYGALIITGTGGTRHLINHLDKPLTCRRYIEQLMNAS